MTRSDIPTVPAQGSISCRSSLLALQSHVNTLSGQAGCKDLEKVCASETGFGARDKRGFNSWLCHLQDGCPWANDLTPLWVSVSSSVNRLRNCLIRSAIVRHEWECAKAPGRAPGPKYVLGDVAVCLRYLYLTPHPVCCQCSEPKEW